MPVWLLALLFAAFVFYTDDYVIAGVLPEIATDLQVSQSAAGQLVTVFSLTVAFGAPAAAVLVARWPRRLLFTLALTLFVVANVVAAVTTSYGLLMAARVLAATAAAMATSALFAAAAVLAPAERQGRYLATVALGVTGSVAVGVPLSTWIGGLWGWRATFAAMAAAGVLALVVLMVFLPRVAPAPAVPLRTQLRALASVPVTLGLLANALTVTGSMVLLTYLAPFLADLAGAEPQARGLVFAVAGFAGMAGIWLGGIASDRWGPDRTLVVGTVAFVAVMAGFMLLWPWRPVPLWSVLPLSALWCGASFWPIPAIQTRLLGLAGPVGPQVLAMNASASYLGASAGGVIGGLLLAGVGTVVLPPAAAVLGLGALLVLRLAVGAARRRSSGRPQPAPASVSEVVPLD